MVISVRSLVLSCMFITLGIKGYCSARYIKYKVYFPSPSQVMWRNKSIQQEGSIFRNC